MRDPSKVYPAHLRTLNAARETRKVIESHLVGHATPEIIARVAADKAFKALTQRRREEKLAREIAATYSSELGHKMDIALANPKHKK